MRQDMEYTVTSSQSILGEVVDRLRAERLAGTTVSQLVADLRRDGIELSEVTTYFREAFLLGGQANIALLPKLENGEPEPGILDDFIAGMVDAARERWRVAPPYPDLLRRRDRIAFEQVARQHDVVLIVCAANQVASQRSSGYRLHGVYRRASGTNAWTGRDGEKLRAELNRRLGADLIQGGPHDTWDKRLALDDADPLRGPMPPVLFFLPDGDVEVRRDARGMKLFYRYLGIDWDEYYPSVEAIEEELA